MEKIQLPQQLILEIMLNCDVPTLKHFLIAHRSFRDLIDEYEVSITYRVRSQWNSEIFVSLFDSQNLSGLSPLESLFRMDSRLKTAKWLAEVVMENYENEEGTLRRSNYGNVGANEPKGDSTRECIAIGWGVLWRLMDIAHSRTWRYYWPLTIYKREEDQHLNSRLEFVYKLSDAELFGYYIMHDTLSRTFQDRVFDRKKALEWKTGNEFGLSNSWLNWLVMREGPRFFEKAWESQEGNEDCAKFITREWSKRSKKQLLIEKTAAVEVEWALKRQERLLCDSLTSRYNKLTDWAKRGREIHKVHDGVVFHLGHRLPASTVDSLERIYQHSDYSSED
ncbi:hypothetical protein B0J14DRAFT_689657 [Halenospora varia]|nr:hypothetical protein B0J14DRAFT_689657 [Halenospora varia]